jgi:hypothetical protein
MSFEGDTRVRSRGKQRGHSEEWPQGISGCVVLLEHGDSTTSMGQ